MTLRRFANKRDISEPAIVELLRAAGCTVVLMDKPTDLLIGYRGKTAIAECKTGKGKLTKDQKDFLASWRGSPVIILRTPADAIETLKQWNATAMERAA
jgi:hypothetical protein